MATALLSLPSLASDSTLADGALLDAEEHNAHRRKYWERTNNLRLGAIDLQNHYASASEPLEKRDGTFWWDSTNLVMKGRRSAAWTPVLDAAGGYSQSLATAGTETFKLGGAIDVNTTRVNAASNQDMSTYTLPANSLSSDGACLSVVAIFSGAGDLYAGFGAANINFFAGAIDKGIVKMVVVRTGTSSFKFAGILRFVGDGGGGTKHVNYSTGTDSLSSNQIMRFYTGPASNGLQEIMLTKLLN